jgi:hypothetical protein
MKPQGKLYLIILCLSLILSGVSSAQAEVIRKFESVVRLQKNATLGVTESILMDFGNQNKHGIFRDIPVEYKRHDKTYTIDLKVLSVTGATGQPLTVKVSRKGYNVDIRIGDANKTVTGKQLYNIHYQVKRAINFFDGKPEVYWNVTGNNWPFPIEKATGKFIPPPGISIDKLRVKAFYGPMGATWEATLSKAKDSVTFGVPGSASLKKGYGLTFVVQLPKGSVSTS